MATEKNEPSDVDETVGDLATQYLEVGVRRGLFGGRGLRDLLGPAFEPKEFKPPAIPDYAAMMEAVDFTPDDSPRRAAEAAETTADYMSQLAGVMEQTLEVNRETAAANRRMLELTARAHAAAEVSERHTRRVANISVWIAAASLATSFASIIISVLRP